MCAKAMKWKIPTDVARRIGYYVYLYVDPRNGRPFYVGKGKGSRVLFHWDAKGKSIKDKTIRSIRALGEEPHIDILSHGLKDAETALRVEAATIDALHLDQLTNRVRGWKTIQYGRMPLRRLLAFYRAKPARITDPVILVRINRLFKPGMSAHELYEATRGVWKIKRQRAEKAIYALAVFEGIVQEVFEIDEWRAAGTTRYLTRSLREVRRKGRIEFIGRKARESVRNRYLDHSVKHHFSVGLQSSVVYLNC